MSGVKLRNKLDVAPIEQNNTTTGRMVEIHTRDWGKNQSDKMIAVRTGYSERTTKSNADLDRDNVPVSLESD